MAKREYLCAFGDCHETEVPYTLSISWKGQRQETVRFCGQKHMCDWMEKFSEYRKPKTLVTVTANQHEIGPRSPSTSKEE